MKFNLSFNIRLYWIFLLANNVAHTALCPRDCECNNQDESSTLSIDCKDRSDNFTADSIEKEINAVLVERNQLSILVIRNTKLKNVPMELCNITSLVQLFIDHNKIERLPDNCFKKLEHLYQINADKNEIEHLQDGLFDGLMNLEVISIEDNKIKSIGLNLFTNSSDLLKLRIIHLHGNMLTELEPWPFIRAVAVPGVAVRVGSYIKHFTNTIGWNSSCKPARTPYRKTRMILDLTKNPIDHIATLVKGLNFHSGLDFICWMVEMSLLFKNNKYICDCMDFKFIAFFKYITHTDYLDGVDCANKFFYQNRRVVQIPLEDLVCNVQENCPQRCQCVSQPSNSTFHVICTNSGLNATPAIIPDSTLPKSLFLSPAKKVYQIGFSGNNISLLKARDYFLDTAYIDLSNSQLLNITDEAWIQLLNVDKTYLHNNLLTTISSVVNSSDFSFTVLSLYNNPLSCSCEQMWLKTWLISVYDRLENPSAIQCDSPTRLKGRSIFLVNDTEFCRTELSSQNVNVSTSTLPIIIASVLVPFALFVAIFTILKICRIKLFTKYGVHPFDRDECDGEEMEFDVFISYADHDKNIAKELLNFLENNSYKVCLHERDFLGGGYIWDNIMESISKSKRVLCIVSEKFLASTFCMQEFHMAHCHSNDIKRQRIIVVKLSLDPLDGERPKEIPNDNRSDDERLMPLEERSPSLQRSQSACDMTFVKNFMARHTYINYRSRSWRQQLLYSLPGKKLGNQNQQEVALPGQSSSGARMNDDTTGLIIGNNI